MNKRYIDFVPAQKKTAKKPVKKPVAKPAKPQTPAEVPLEEIFGEKPEPAGVSKGLNAPKFGVIEDYHPKFVAAEVKKRPLGGRKTKAAIKEPDEAKTAQTAKKAPKTIKPAFVNTNKIEKRPLSRGAYPRKNVSANGAIAGGIGAGAKVGVGVKTGMKTGAKSGAAKDASKPVRIVDTPEKDSKAGIIIAVILTIILGAAAGTVAFLLLPK